MEVLYYIVFWKEFQKTGLAVQITIGVLVHLEYSKAIPPSILHLGVHSNGALPAIKMTHTDTPST